jgi:hypothetical protein
MTKLIEIVAEYHGKKVYFTIDKTSIGAIEFADYPIWIGDRLPDKYSIVVYLNQSNKTIVLDFDNHQHAVSAYNLLAHHND